MDQKTSTFYQTNQLQLRPVKQKQFGQRSKSVFTKDHAVDKYLCQTLNEYVKEATEIEKNWPVVQERVKVDGVRMAQLRNKDRANKVKSQWKKDASDE